MFVNMYTHTQTLIKHKIFNVFSELDSSKGIKLECRQGREILECFLLFFRELFFDFLLLFYIHYKRNIVGMC